jgi:hypothetical protein
VTAVGFNISLSAHQIGLIVITLLIFYSATSLLSAIYYWFCVKRHNGSVQASVTLILPLTGYQKNLKNLLKLLELQCLRPNRLVIAIESEGDLAYPLAKTLVTSVSFPVSIVIAGIASTSSQKCHNVLAAARTMKVDDDYVVLLDADISPPTWWLSAAIKPLLTKQYDIVSGYRWQVPPNNNFAEHVVTFIDRSIALTTRPPGLFLLWGGTIAMSSALLQELVTQGVLEHTISDDLMIADYAAKQRYRILNRRVLLVPSTPPENVLLAWNFMVRQFQIIKIYRPNLWRFAVARSLFLGTSWIVLLLQYKDAAIFYSALAIIFSLLFIKQVVSMSIASSLGYHDRALVLQYQYGLILFRPAIDIVVLLALCRSMRASVVSWSHVTYRVMTPNVIKIQARTPSNTSKDSRETV